MTDAALLARRRVAFTRRGKPITYKKFSTSAPNFKTRKHVVTYVDSAIDLALKGHVSDQDVKASDGRYQASDFVFKIIAGDLPETPPSRKSLLESGDDTFEIVGHSISGDGLIYRVFCRKVVPVSDE